MRTRTIEQAPKIRVRLAEIYAEKFSEADLVRLTEFFRTPAGRKYVTLLPELEASARRLVNEEAMRSDPKVVHGLEIFKRREEQEKAQQGDLEERARNGDREAMYRLGVLYCSSTRGDLNQNDKVAKCFEWKRSAAKAGLREAQYDIGYSYREGRYGNGKSGTEMFRWMKFAADQGHPAAQYFVGSAYAGNTSLFGNQPTGVKINGKEAETWLEKAANNGSVDAILILAAMYVEGRLVDRNMERAIHWYSRAAEKRNPTAVRKLGEIYESGMAGEPNLQEALKWYKQAAGVPPR